MQKYKYQGSVKEKLSLDFELSALENGEELYSLTGLLWCFVEHFSSLRLWLKVLQYNFSVTSLGHSGVSSVSAVLILLPKHLCSE